MSLYNKITNEGRKLLDFFKKQNRKNGIEMIEKDKIERIERNERIEREKKDIWKYCQICGFSVFNGLEFKHQKDGNFHISCLSKKLTEQTNRLVFVLKDLEKSWKEIKEKYKLTNIVCNLRITIEDDVITLR